MPFYARSGAAVRPRIVWCAVVLWAADRFTGPFGVGPTLHALSTIPFVLTLPMLAAGAYFLDLLEKRPPAPRHFQAASKADASCV